MQNELKPMNSNVIRFPVELVATPTTELLRALAPDARQVSLLAEAFGLEEPDWLIRDCADSEMALDVAMRKDWPAAPAEKRAALEAMLKPIVNEAVRLCRKALAVGRLSEQAASKLATAHDAASYWRDLLENVLEERAFEWARAMIEAYEAAQAALGAERAIDLAIRGEKWTPVDHDKDVEVLLLAAAR
ncbi:hypothetical protein M2322_004140 [Rhodoblastus acidophilus]|uniref:hypothetical protein n=1 Tax=Rhodoblastus acidophilus TaxID=1074 RepID=UPI0022250F4E|nr:hypothetical protein [Rhodoblastus acidophilus]MCW2318571.1 hypothetical protein [Rhodoblastus acidophilus]